MQGKKHGIVLEAFLAYHIEQCDGALINVSVLINLLDNGDGDLDAALGNGFHVVQRSLSRPAGNRVSADARNHKQ